MTTVTATFTLLQRHIIAQSAQTLGDRDPSIPVAVYLETKSHFMRMRNEA